MPDEDLSSDQFLHMRRRLLEAGFDHYEVSNFGKPGYHSRHNSAYWSGKAYLGIGPSAHSYINGVRRWNVANNSKYLKGISDNAPYWEEEKLSPNSQYNELLMTGLRTSKGVDLEKIKALHPSYLEHLKSEIKPFEEYIVEIDNHLRLTPNGLLMADRIASDLFIVD